MSRPTKDAVEYFPHYASQGKTIFILEQKYGNDGYACWFKLLELLSSTDGHVYDCNNESEWLFLQAKTHLSADTVHSILDTLCSLGAIDKDLWNIRKIWCQNLVNNLQPVYANRRRPMPLKPVITNTNHIENELLQVETTLEDDSYQLSTIVMPQSKVKYSKVKKSISADALNVLKFGSGLNVKLTQVEYDNLQKEYPTDYGDIVELLSLHISEKGDASKAQTHIFTIKKWVIDAVKLKKAKGWQGYFNQIPIAQDKSEPSKSKWQSCDYESRSD